MAGPAAIAAALRLTEAPRAEPLAAPQRRIEEVVVTAQRTERSAADVPISPTMLDDAFLAEQGVTDYRELGRFVPNAHIDPGNGEEVHARAVDDEDDQDLAGVVDLARDEAADLLVLTGWHSRLSSKSSGEISRQDLPRASPESLSPP